MSYFSKLISLAPPRYSASITKPKFFHPTNREIFTESLEWGNAQCSDSLLPSIFHFGHFINFSFDILVESIYFQVYGYPQNPT